MSTMPQPNTALLTRKIARVSEEAMKTMAIILDDPNVIHLDPEAVRALGLGDRVINQGPTNCGYVMDMLLENFPEAEIATFRTRFLANVLGGDEVVAGGLVESVIPTPDGWQIDCSFWLDVTGRGRALDGRARLTTPRS